MKYIINIKWLLLLFVIAMSSSSFAQGIRKNYLEMSNSERTQYTNVINTFFGNSTMAGFRDTHASPGGHVHGNIIFLPWHREFIRQFEQELQDENPYLSIPYWDWRTDRDPTASSFWDNDFLDLNNLNDTPAVTRNIGASSSLPTTMDIEGVLDDNFTTFAGTTTSRGSLEDQHDRPHVWVGGTMGSIPTAAYDPIFYLHHAMIDFLWQKWEDKPNNTSSFSGTTIPTYPGVNPNNLVNTRTLGIFYAENQLAKLSGYNVSNDNLSSEKFVYQYKIEAKDDFLVPSGKNAEFRSCNVIELLPGFEADNGAVFEARIDSDCNFSTAALVADNSGEEPENVNQAEERLANEESVFFKNYPNPFTGQTTIEFTLSKDTPVTLSVADVTGKQIAVLLNNEQQTTGTHQVTFDGSSHPAGMYYYTIQAGEYIGTQKMTLIK